MNRLSYVRARQLIPGLLALALVLVAGPIRSLGQTQDDLTVAYLYNFGRAVEWPPAAFADGDAHFTIGIVGRPKLALAFAEEARGKTVDGREVRVLAPSDPSEVANCQILFIADSAQDAPMLAAAKGKPELSVGEGADFLKAGGMIAFSRRGTRLVFDANPEAIAAASLIATAAILNNRQQDSDLAIIVARDLSLDGVTSHELEQIFRGETKTGPGGVKFVIFSRERTSTEFQVVLEKIYHMTVPAFDRYFMRALYIGAVAEAPRVIRSATAMKRIAAGTPGAVTYVFASQLDSTVKALKIDGFSPGDSQYPLKGN
jgi:hypothetical protein